MIHARPDYQDRIIDVLDPEGGGIPDDEPVLLIRGQDAIALAALDAYASCARAIGVDPRILRQLDEQRDRIVAWQRDVKVKVPDLPS